MKVSGLINFLGLILSILSSWTISRGIIFKKQNDMNNGHRFLFWTKLYKTNLKRAE